MTSGPLPETVTVKRSEAKPAAWASGAKARAASRTAAPNRVRRFIAEVPPQAPSALHLLFAARFADRCNKRHRHPACAGMAGAFGGSPPGFDGDLAAHATCLG